MSEHAEQAGNKFEGMRTTLLGTAGTLATLTLKEWSDMAAACAGFATALYMLAKVIDWMIGKLVARRARKRKSKH